MNHDLTLKTIKFMPFLFLTTLIVSCLGFRFRVLDELSLFWPANILVFCLMISFRARKGTIKGKTLSICIGFLVGYAAMLSAALLMDNNSPLKNQSAVMFVQYSLCCDGLVRLLPAVSVYRKVVDL
ncbi:hypothetical protein GJS26_00560 [Pectobacterium carotovorum subsp. carotovorum]|nr:hypothetical protein [Pectobacterium carotovorum subsp. carotovorum]